MSVVAAKGVNLAGKTLFSGIQPTGVFHLGNLLGAVQSWVDLSRSAPDSTTIRFMVADLHAITVAKDPKLLREMRWSALASILAAGIDPKRCTVYFQSQVPAHTELFWLLSSLTSMGYLNRMVQWKSKANLDPNANINKIALNQVTDLNLGLFGYPALQAADILIQNADFVPVGDDQSQHLELTRHIAGVFNHRFGETFTLPATVFTPFKKILSLRDGSKKMSKSDPDQSACVLITDDETTIVDKLRRAITDSVQGPITYDPEMRPEVSNLLLIASGLIGVEPEDFVEDHRPQNHKQLKDVTAEIIMSKVAPIRREYHRLVKDRLYLEAVAKEGQEKVMEATTGHLNRIKNRMGFQ